jgi:hypothetical protein
VESKLGLHIQKRRQGWPNVVADAVPAVVKSLEWGIIDDWIAEEQSELVQYERAAKWARHNVLLLGRHALAEQPLDAPEEAVERFWSRLLSDLTGGEAHKTERMLSRMRRFDAWEGYNEVGTGAAIRNLGRFDALLARRFHDEGMRYAGGGFSMGQPSLVEWPHYCQALLDEVDAGRGDLPDFLHLHEYWYPRGNWQELLAEDGTIDAAKMRAATSGYMLRWRDLYRDAGTPAALKLPVIISECGWDMGYPVQAGFRSTRRSDEDYLQWLAWYDGELQKPLDGVDYVVGAAIYTYGHEPRWSSFEIDQYWGRGILEMLCAYLREQNRAPHPQKWRELWAPPATPETPLVEESHFVLLAQHSNGEWRHALDRYLDTFKVTNGQSLDDAVRLAARRHHITLVGSADSVWGVPADWEREIRRRNPRILIDRMAAISAADLRRIADGRAQRGDRYGRGD